MSEVMEDQYMTTIGEAFDAMGMALKESETVCIAFGDEGFKEYSLDDVADRPVGANVYFSTGTFRHDMRWGRGARTAANVLRVLELPFDFDFKDFLKQDKADIVELTDEELRSYIPLLQDAVERIFAEMHLPIHRLDYTGYGLSAHIKVAPHSRDKVRFVKKYHAAIVSRINAIFGSELADAQVKDAGTRIMRLVPCQNVYTLKTGERAEPRASFTIYNRDGVADEATLMTAADYSSSEIRENLVHFLPSNGRSIPDSDAQMIVERLQSSWVDGQRHFMGLAVGGYLAKNLVPEEQALQIVERLAADDRKPYDRVKAVRDSYDKARRGVEVSGWYPLSSMVDPADMAAIDTMLDAHRKANGSRLLINGKPIKSGDDLDDKERPATFDEYPEPPPAAFYGWFGRYVDLVYPTTEATRGFHLAAGLTIAGAIAGKRIAINNASENVYPNQYTILVGPTGSSRKGTTMKRAHRLPTYRDPARQTIHAAPFAVVRNLGSGASVVKTLKENPNTLIVMEEATTLFNNMHRQGGEELLDRMIEAWDTPDFLQDNVKNNPSVATQPFLSLIAGIQPGRLEDALGANEIESGLANRLGIFFGVRRRILARAPKLDPADGYRLYRELHDAIMSYPEGTVLDMDEEAGAFWDDWYVQYSSYKGSEDELAMRIRHPDMALKWALLFAVSERADEINLPHLEGAIAVLDWMWEGVKRRLPTWGVSIDNKIEALIRRNLEDYGAMKRRDLQRKCQRRQWSGREFAAVFRAMVENGHLMVDAHGVVALAEHVERDQAHAERESA